MPTPIAPYDMLTQQQLAMAQGAVPGVVPMPGPSQYPPQFSYGYAPQMSTSRSIFGNLGGGAAATVGAMPSVAAGVGTVAGIGTMFSSSPLLMGAAMLEPTTLGFTAGMGALTGGGGVAGAAALGLPLIGAGLAAGATAHYAGRRFVRGAQSQEMLNAQLSGLPFANASAQGFRGFGYQQLNQINAMMREFESADPFTTMKDMSQLMDKFTGMEMHQGVQDAKDFGKKFKEFASAVRDIATEMGTTIDEASKMFGQMRLSGFYTSQDVMGNTRSLQVARASGMSEDQFFGMQQQSSQTTRQAAMSGLSGARTSARLANELMLASMSTGSGGAGLMTGEHLMDITGAGSASEAAAQMGGQFTGLLTNYLTRSGAGKALLMSLGEKRGGQYTGDLDMGLFNRQSSGQISLSDLSGMAGPRVRGAEASFETRTAEIASALLEQDQGAGAVFESIEAEAKKWAQNREGVTPDTAIRLFLQKMMGADEATAAAFSELIQHRQEVQAAFARKMRSEGSAAALQLEMRRNRTFGGLKQRISGTWEDAFAPVGQAGADMQTWFNQAGQDFEDAAFGVSRGNITDTQTSEFARRLVGGQLIGTTRPDRTSWEQMSEGTAFRSVARRLGGETTLDVRARLMSGGDLQAGDIPLDRMEERPMEHFMSGRGGRVTRNLMAQYNAAKSRGDEAGAEQILGSLRKEIEAGGLAGGTLGARSNKEHAADVDRMLAYVAQKHGASGLAKSLMLKGTTESTAYADVKTLRKRVSTRADFAGLSAEEARALSRGEGGANVLAFMAEKGLGVDAFAQFRLSEAGFAAGEDADAFAAAWNAEHNTNFSTEELMQAEELARKTKAYAGQSGSQWGGEVAGVSRSDMWKGLTANVLAQQSGVMMAEHQDTLRGILASAPEEVKRRVKGLEALGSKTIGGRTYLNTLMGVTKDIRGGALTGVAGGEELAGIGAAMEAAAGGREELLKFAGVESMDELTSMANLRGIGVEGKNLTAAQQDELINRLGAEMIETALTTTSGGGTFLRGQPKEERMLAMLDTTAVKIQLMAETVDKLAVETGIKTVQEITQEGEKSEDEH